MKTTQRYLNVTDAELLKLMNERLWRVEPSADSDCQPHSLKLVAGAGFEPATFGL
jgi:hypothetical protein